MFYKIKFQSYSFDNIQSYFEKSIKLKHFTINLFWIFQSYAHKVLLPKTKVVLQIRT